MEKSKNFVSRKFTVDECNSNPNVHFNRCKKEPKPSVLAPLAPPGRFELPTFRLGGERYYPAELRRLIHDIQFFCNLWRAALLPLRRRTLYPGEVRGHIQKIFNYEGLWGSNGSIVRRRSLYTAELRGHRKMRTVDSPAYGAQGTGSYYHSVFGGKSQLACKKLQRSSQ